MKRVLTAGVLIPLVLLATFLAPHWLFTGLIGIVSLLATIEYMTLAAGYGYEPFRFLTYLLLLTYYGFYIWAGSSGGPAIDTVVTFFVFFFTLAPFVFLTAGMARKDMRSVLPGAAISYVALSYISFSLSCLAAMRGPGREWFRVLFTLLVIWVGDTAAYYVGRSVGRTKFAPSISPKKTWEGAIASAIGSIAVGVLLVRFVPVINNGIANLHLGGVPQQIIDTPVGVTALVALAINIAGQVGDLLESLIKRGANVKDSGTLLPGHGGILDRVDALLFAAPVAFLVTGPLR